MKRKRIASLLMTLMVAFSCTPMSAFATVKTKNGAVVIETLSPSLQLVNHWYSAKYYQFNLDSTHVLTSKSVIGNNPLIIHENADSRDTDSELDINALSVDDCLALAKTANSASVNGYELDSSFEKDEIAPIFGYGSPDVKNAATSTVLRDCFLVTAVIRAKAGDVGEISKIKTFIEQNKSDLVDFTNIAEQQTGYENFDDLLSWCGQQIKKEESDMTDTANQQTVSKLQDIEYSGCDDTYKHIIATRILCAQSGDPADLSKGFLKGAKDEFGSVISKDIVAGGNESETVELLNKVLTDAYNMGDAGNRTFKACMSIVLERGSKYGYGVPVEVKTDEVKDKLESSKGSANADKGVEDALKAAKKILDDNPSVKDNDQRLCLTMAERAKSAMYLMSATDQVQKILDEYSDINQLCRIAGDQNTTIGSEPYILNKPNDITHFDGYVYLNNISNDIDKMASVIIPLTYKIKKQEDANNMQIQLAMLKTIQETNNIMNNPDQIGWENKYEENGKYSTDNSKKLNPIEEAWNRDVSQTIDGELVTTSLKKEYDRLVALGVAFPDIEKLAASTEHPLNEFYFDLSKQQVSAPIRVGAALSSTFIPFKTNMYNPVTYRQVKDDDDFFRFHAIYGNYRKALMIDTDVASVSKLRTTGKVGSLKVCTLKDLLHCEKEITLYADSNFYNADVVKDYKTEGMQRVVSSSKDGEDKSIAQKIVDSFSVNLNDVLKTGDKTQYSDRLADVSTYAQTKQASYKPSSGSKDEILLDGANIDSFLDVSKQKDGDYNVMRAYAVDSAIYRDKDVFSYMRQKQPSPIFKASKNLATQDSVEMHWKESYFNYTLLKNIESSMNVNYKSNLDEGKPVYLDVYGNILTESGDVVIPAAANATLNTHFCPYNAAFITTYGQKFWISDDMDFVNKSGAGSVMEDSVDRKRWEFSNKSVDGSADLNELSTASDSAMKTLFNKYATYIKQGTLDFDLYAHDIIPEVLRGAPLDNISKEKENLLVGTNVSKAGIARAVQFDELKDAISSVGQNAIIALPNLAFVDGIEYIVFFVYKIALILTIWLIIIHIFRAGMDQGFGFGGMLRMFLSIALTIGAIFAIPKVFDISYYQVNKLFLQKNAISISMLNLEKKEAGVEVGMVDTGEPKVNSKLYMKLKKVDIPWYDAFWDVITSNITAKMSDIYTSYAEKDLAFGQDDFEFKNGYLYVDTNKLFDESVVTFNANYNNIYTASKGDTPASFYSPYFTFLHALCIDVNTYNKNKNIYAYSTQVYGGGKVKSLGLIEAYLTSDDFISEDSNGNEITSDMLHLRDIYGTQGTKNPTAIYDSQSIEKMKKSLWYNDNLSEDDVENKIAKINKEAKLFVAKNKDLIGRVSDETFLKVMALDLATYYNKIFGIGAADSLEIYNLSEDDLARLACAPTSDVIEKSPLSYSRFIYEEAGTPGIFAGALLEIVNFLSGWIKPISTLLIFIIIFASLFFYRIVLRRQTRSNRGYIWTVCALCATNVLYAGTLKLSMWLPDLGLPTTVCLILQSIIQSIIVTAYLWIVWIVLVNWKDLGEADFSARARDLQFRLVDGRLGGLLNFDRYHNKPQFDRLRKAIKNRKRRAYTTESSYSDYSDYGSNYSSYDDYGNYSDNYSEYEEAKDNYLASIRRQRDTLKEQRDTKNREHENSNHTKYRRD